MQGVVIFFAPQQDLNSSKAQNLFSVLPLVKLSYTCSSHKRFPQTFTNELAIQISKAIYATENGFYNDGIGMERCLRPPFWVIDEVFSNGAVYIDSELALRYDYHFNQEYFKDPEVQKAKLFPKRMFFHSSFL